MNHRNIFSNKHMIVILVSMLLAILILSGCSSSNSSSSSTPKKIKCSTESDCSSLTCASCSGGVCVEKGKKNCCGNAKCEDPSENKCSCEKDCGICKSNSTFMIAKCSDTKPKECIITPAVENAVKEEKSYPSQTGNTKLNIMPQYDVPFYLGYSTINLRIKPDSIEKNSKVMVKRVRIYEKTKAAPKPLAEKDFNQILYTPESEFNEAIIIEIERNNTKTKDVLQIKKALTLEVQYDIITSDVNGKETSKSQTFTKDIASDLSIIMSPTSICDITTCDDGNTCTKDSCQPINGYEYCTHAYLANCCGNKICDASEDKCSCNTDCGICEMNYGDYISYSCSNNNRCEPGIKQDLIEEKTQRFNSAIIPELTYSTKISYKQPSNIVDSINLEYEIIVVKPEVTDATITLIELTESGKNLLGELKPVASFKTVGQISTYSITPSLLSLYVPEKTIKPQLVTTIQYTIKKENAEPQTFIKKDVITLDEIAFIKLP